jgi:L-ascorbate metabolism protein UlaG (beta-lactamase superfamily)
MASNGVRILFVGHSTVLVDMDGVRLLTDPLLRPRVAHLRRIGKVAANVQRGVDAVLISHLHYDHLDIPSLQRLGREMPVVVPRGASGLLRKRGFRAVTELGIGEELRIGALAVQGTPAVHDSGRMPFGMRAEPMGHLIRGSRSVYFAGDTDLFDGIADLGPVDVALIPIWGWGRSLGRGHLDPRGAAEAVVLLQASVAIPIHWGTYFPIHDTVRTTPELVDAPVQRFAEHMREIAPETDVRVLRPGEETAL